MRITVNPVTNNNIYSSINPTICFSLIGHHQVDKEYKDINNTVLGEN
jgi:hypothetical protein